MFDYTKISLPNIDMYAVELCLSNNAINFSFFNLAEPRPHVPED